MAKLAAIIAGLREHGRTWFWRTAAALVLTALFFVAGGGVSQNDRWQITRVEVSGARAVEHDAIEAFAREELKGNYYYAYARENSYLFPRREIETGLMTTFPRLASASAMRTDPHTIAIAVTERTPYALWCGQTYAPNMRELANCYFIDETGFLFDRAPTFSSGVYVEVYGTLEGTQNGDPLRAHISTTQFVLMHDLVRGLAHEVGDTLRVESKPDSEMTLMIKKSDHYPVLANAELRFKDTMTADEVVKNLVAALPVQFPPGTTPKKKLLYIDMRFGNKIFFGFEN